MGRYEKHDLSVGLYFQSGLPGFRPCISSKTYPGKIIQGEFEKSDPKIERKSAPVGRSSFDGTSSSHILPRY